MQRLKKEIVKILTTASDSFSMSFGLRATSSLLIPYGISGTVIVTLPYAYKTEVEMCPMNLAI